MKNKITQEQQVFYKLYKTYKEDKEKWVNAWEFVGEMFVEELGIWTLMTYKTPANGMKIYFTNPDLISQQQIKNKNKSKYYQYKFKPNPSIDKYIAEKCNFFYAVVLDEIKKWAKEQLKDKEISNGRYNTLNDLLDYLEE